MIAIKQQAKNFITKLVSRTQVVEILQCAIFVPLNIYAVYRVILVSIETGHNLAQAIAASCVITAVFISFLFAFLTATDVYGLMLVATIKAAILQAHVPVVIYTCIQNVIGRIISFVNLTVRVLEQSRITTSNSTLLSSADKLPYINFPLSTCLRN